MTPMTTATTSNTLPTTQSGVEVTVSNPQLTSLLRAFDAGRAVRAFSAVDRALAAIDRNASPKIVADWLALQI